MLFRAKYYKTDLWKSLGKSERIILLVLATYSDKFGGKCFPSITKLREATTMKRNTICDNIKLMVVKGALSKIKKGRSSHYDLSVWKNHD